MSDPPMPSSPSSDGTTLSHTSSIGPQWPPERASYGRIKGIYNVGLLRRSEDLDGLGNELEQLLKRLEPVVSDRISIRAWVSEALVREPHPQILRWGEAVVPMTGCGAPWDGTCLVYLGRNAKSRSCDDRDLERSLENVAIAETKGPRSAAEMIRRVSEGGYALRLPTREQRLGDVDLLRNMADLYSRFGWEAEEVRAILANPNSLIAVAEHEGVPVSAGLAELSCISFADGNALRIVEFTEAATKSVHRGRGLYSGIVATLCRRLVDMSNRQEVLGGELQLAFGECSGHDLGVLIAAKHLGRTFSRRVGLEWGLPLAGFLPQHVPIAGAPRSMPYNELFPTFLSHRALVDFAAS